MRIFRISGFHNITGKKMVAQIAAIDLEEAYDLMRIDHRHLSCEYEYE